MTNINVCGLEQEELNRIVRYTEGDITLDECCGERFVGCGLSGKTITINGTPGNALGAYLDGCNIVVNGNVQDAVGDTMNEGSIVIHGSAGDALGYAMRGGKIYVQGDSGYRTGIHMKQYQEKRPVIIIGGKSGSFLGEYLAGGLIVVLGIGCENEIPLGNFTGTGMHGGRIIVRSKYEPVGLPPQVALKKADEEDLKEIKKEISEYLQVFQIEMSDIMNEDFYILTANAKNPYKRLYTAN